MSSTGDVGAGHKLGRYELLVPIALGGMASVWAARVHGPILKIVAVKLMREELGNDPNFEEMFLDEAELVSQIHHPNVCEILDVGEEDGTLYQVMELVDGEPLNLVLRESKALGGVPLAMTLRIIAQVCAGLHAAHELRGPDGKPVGLVHRDVSPQNLLVGFDGVVKVVDFGVAKANSNLQQTRVGEVKGKVPYMSPEQGRGGHVDRRSDIFSLGVVFYQLATGKHPFMADSEPATLHRIGSPNPAERPKSLARDLPAEIDEVIMKAIAKNREERFATMGEMLRAIKRATTPALKAGDEQVAEFMRRIAGPRGERRREAIKEAVQISREVQSLEDAQDGRTSRAATRDRVSLVTATPSPVDAGAPGVDQAHPVVRRRAGLAPPWHARLQAARRAQIAALSGVAIALVVAVIVGFLIAGSAPDDRPAPTVASALRIQDTLIEATRVVATAVRPLIPSKGGPLTSMPSSASSDKPAAPQASAQGSAPQPSKPTQSPERTSR